MTVDKLLKQEELELDNEDQNEDNTEENTEDNTEDHTEEMEIQIHDNLNTKFDIEEDSFHIKDVIQRISKLQNKEKIHILNILRMSKVEFTKNSNGYFFNFLNIDKNIINEICNCLDLIEKNSDILKELERRRSELLNYYKNLIEERLNNNIKQRRNEYIKKLHVKNDCNLQITIKPRSKIKRRYKYDVNTDPDVLIKDYIKSKNTFNKNGVYHRIVTSIKFIKNKSRRDIKAAEDITKDDITKDDINDDTGYEDTKDDESIIDNTTDELYLENEDNNSNKDDNDNEDYVLDDMLENDDKEEVIEDQEEEQEDEEDIKQMNFLYYKKLLRDQGFKFNDNKDCFLIYQDYIY